MACKLSLPAHLSLLNNQNHEFPHALTFSGVLNDDLHDTGISDGLTTQTGRTLFTSQLARHQRLHPDKSSYTCQSRRFLEDFG